MKLDFLIREKPKSRRDDGMMFWEESVIVKEIEAIGIAATPELLSMLKDENNDIRYKAAEFLGRIRDARSIEPLIQILQTEHDLKV
ncbi:MAG: HEAT repeat domain-containing protein [Planctomycetes bacterium]|nr:HEAT repeat domain-containing protein [Planctomycetota bacterium]